MHLNIFFFLPLLGISTSSSLWLSFWLVFVVVAVVVWSCIRSENDIDGDICLRSSHSIHSWKQKKKNTQKTTSQDSCISFQICLHSSRFTHTINTLACTAHHTNTHMNALRWFLCLMPFLRCSCAYVTSQIKLCKQKKLPNRFHLT